MRFAAPSDLYPKVTAGIGVRRATHIRWLVSVGAVLAFAVAAAVSSWYYAFFQPSGGHPATVAGKLRSCEPDVPPPATKKANHVVIPQAGAVPVR